MYINRKEMEALSNAIGYLENLIESYTGEEGDENHSLLIDTQLHLYSLEEKGIRYRAAIKWRRNRKSQD